MTEPLFGGKKSVRAHAVLLGERLDLKALEVTDPIASAPLTVTAAENGLAVLFRWGAVVVFNLAGVEEASFLGSLKSLVGDPATPETERAEVRVGEPDKEERVTGGVVSVREITVERLQIVAEVLAKSVVLAHYERTIAKTFDRIEPLAQELQERGRTSRRVREILRDIGETLLIQHRMVGRVEISDKPDVLWDKPELESFHVKLIDEYEIRERHLALERKIRLISDTAATLNDLLQHNRSHRVEWYIVGLIVFEIVLSMWDRITGGR